MLQLSLNVFLAEADLLEADDVNVLLETKQPPAEAGGFGLRTGSPDTRRLNDASMAAPSGNHRSDWARSDAPDTA